MRNRRDRATLLMSCPDRRGIVATLAQVLHGHGCNILDSDQHTDESAGQFFQRIGFDLREMSTDRHSLEAALAEVAGRFDMQWRLVWGERRKRVAIMVSRYDHCLVDLLWRHRAGELDCEIPVVVSNHPDLRDIVEHHGLRFELVPISKDNKRAQEAREIELFDQLEVDTIVLARYMQVLSEELCQHFAQRIINIHHSFLPAFIGGKPYHQAHDRGVKLIGATAHFVTSELDEGPIIEQDVARTSHHDSVDDLVRKGRDIERLVLSRAVRHVLEDRVLVFGRRTVVFAP